MGRKKIVLLACLLICLTIPCLACEKQTSPKVKESWAYVHDPGTEVLRLCEDGTAMFEGKNYKYAQDDQFITLTDDKNSVQKMRYVIQKDQMLLYQTTIYHYDGSGEHNGIEGVWKGGEANRMSYEFTDQGTFMEDEVFPGHFAVDEEKGTIKLMYNDHFADTYLYYKLDGDELTVEYPWPMVKTQESDD